MRLKEFAPAGGGGSGDYFQELASAWYNGVFDTGSLQKGIKSQQDVERLLNRGIVCPDGKTRKLHIDYNSDFDGVEIYSDDYYEYGDHDDTIDSRTGQKWGPYDFMAFSDEDLSEGAVIATTPGSMDPGGAVDNFKQQMANNTEIAYQKAQQGSLNEFAPGDSGDGSEDDALRNYARMWWAGDEATQMQIERALAKMGWEIGEDEGSYDNGGVFVVRAGDINGDSYTSWAAEDLTEGVTEAKWNPYDQGDFPINYNANDSDEVDDTGKAEKWRAMQDYYSNRATVVAALQAQRGLMHPAHGTKHGVQTVMSTSLGKRVVKTFPNKEKAYDYAGVHNYEVVEIKDTGLATNPITLNVVLGHGEHKKQMSLQFPDMGKAQQWADRYHAEILGQDMAEGDLNEKSTSQAQFRTMAAAAHDPKFAKKVGIKQSVAREFNRADTGQDYKDLPKRATEGATVTTTPGSIEPGGAVDNFKQQMANNTERDMAEGNRKPEPPEADYGDDYQDMVKRVKKLAGLGPLKTQYDPNKRVYRNMPTAVQPKK